VYCVHVIQSFIL